MSKNKPIIFNILILFVIVFFAIPEKAHGQLFKKNEEDSIKKNSFLALPVLFYLPETRWGYGAFGMYNFYTDKNDQVSSSSQIQFGVAYTQNKQLLLYAPYNLFWKEDLWRADGEIGYYKYSYDFFGVGPDIDQNFSETYEVDYPRFRVHLNRKVKNRFYVGAQYWFEDQKINQGTFDPNGRLQTGNVAGSKGGITAGVGLLLTYDSRDNVYFPESGFYAQGTAHTNNKFVLSDYDFNRFRLDIRNYYTPKKNHTIANQIFIDHIVGDAPFTQMAFFGGSKRARGYYQGRYRDKNMFLYQFEYRPILYKRFGAVAFFNYGMVAPELSKLSFNQGNYSYGAGIRFNYDTDKKVNVRLDAAFGPGTSGFYFTFGEAF